MPRRLTTEEVKQKVEALYNGEYVLLGEYISSSKPITLKHLTCGTIYTIKGAKQFLTEGGSLCPNCKKSISRSNKKVSKKEFIQKLKDAIGNEYSYISGYSNMNTKCLLRHNVCGHEWLVSPHMFLGVKQTRCPKCANEHRGKYLKDKNYLAKLLEDKEYGTDYEWLETYKGDNKLKHEIKHLSCGHEYEVRPNDFQQGYQCPLCSNQNGSSKEEDKLYDFISSHYSENIIRNYRDGNKELDFYFPELNIGIEYNGYYWHSDRHKSKNSHLEKLEYYAERGIDVYFIDSIDIIAKPEILLSKILHILKCNQNKEKIYARKCKLVYNIPFKEKKEFLMRNHLQGNSIDKFNLGLYYENSLVSIMTFSFSRNNVNNKLQRMELVRFASDIEYVIVGGFSKLLSHSIKYINEVYPEYSTIYSYADRGLSKGNVYYVNGFTLDHICKPSYYYVKDEKKINRFTMRKSELKRLYPEYYNEDLTEFKIADKIPRCYRIWNCGNYLFKLNLKKED